jgi:hypothetical protein
MESVEGSWRNHLQTAPWRMMDIKKCAVPVVLAALIVPAKLLQVPLTPATTMALNFSYEYLLNHNDK